MTSGRPNTISSGKAPIALSQLDRPEILAASAIEPVEGAGEFSNYIAAFTEEISQRLNKAIRLSWSINGPAAFDTVGVCFDVAGVVGFQQSSMSAPWGQLLDKIHQKQAQDDRRTFFGDRPIRISDDSGFMSVKSNQRRDWTAIAPPSPLALAACPAQM